MVIIEADLESSRALATRLVIEEAKILEERQGKELLRRERMLWAKKVERDEITRLKKVERERKIMIHKHAKDITNHEKDTERLNIRLSAMNSNFDEERAKYHKNINKVKASVQLETHKFHQQEILRRELVAKEVENRKEVLQTVADLRQWVDEMYVKLKEAKYAAKVAMKGKLKSYSAVEKRLHLLTALRVKLTEVQDNLADESHQMAGLEKMQKLQLEIKRERPVGWQGVSLKWPVHIVLLICELLVNGTPPSAVTDNIQTKSAAMTGQ